MAKVYVTWKCKLFKVQIQSQYKFRLTELSTNHDTEIIIHVSNTNSDTSFLLIRDKRRGCWRQRCLSAVNDSEMASASVVAVICVYLFNGSKGHRQTFILLYTNQSSTTNHSVRKLHEDPVKLQQIKLH